LNYSRGGNIEVCYVIIYHLLPKRSRIALEAIAYGKYYGIITPYDARSRQ